VKRILILLFVAIITIGIILFINNPGLLDKVWLWIVGLIGSIVAIVQHGWKWLQQQYESAKKKLQPKSKENVSTQPVPATKPGFIKTNQEINRKITLLRMQNEEDSTLGILFYEDKFYCYTIEDFCSDELNNCRVPAGKYHLGISVNSGLNTDYAAKIKNFNGHLQLMEAPTTLTGIIHFGGLGADLKGDIILTDITQNQDSTILVEQSKVIYENFYQLVNNRLQNGEEVIFEISDENWFKEKLN